MQFKMARVRQWGSGTSVYHTLWCLNRQSDSEIIRHVNVVQNCRNSPSSSCEMMQSRFLTSCNHFLALTQVKSSMTKPNANVTTVLSHFWAGDLHILQSFVNNQVSYDFSIQRSISRMPTRNSKTHYYDVLGLNPNATQSQIKTAYYKMSKLHHPDVTASTNNSNSHILFTEINEAYEILGNLRKRRMYDRGVFKPRDTRGDTVMEEEPSNYTQAYKESSIFERGNRPPPPTGRSKIYNFDEFYRQHYNEMRERRAKEYQEYVKYKETKDNASETQKADLPMYVKMTLWSLVVTIGIMMLFENNYDNDTLPKQQKTSDSSIGENYYSPSSVSANFSRDQAK